MRKRFRVTRDMRSRDPEKAARAFARESHPVLLLFGTTGDKCDCGDADCRGSGKHPIPSLHPHGLKDATTDEEFIARGFERYPNANYGVVPTRGLFIFDVDGLAGEALIAALNLHATATVKTNRGRHLYCDAVGFADNKPPKLEGVDYRFNGNGYVVGPGSRHVTGTIYRFVGDADRATEITPEHFKAKRKITVNFSSGKRAIAEGGRNNEPTRIAGALRALGLSKAAIRQALLAINDKDCSPPLLPKGECQESCVRGLLTITP